MTVQANYKDIADNYIRALGGADNIDSLVNCATRILYECLGLPDNILNITVIGSAITVQVVDPDWVDPYDVMLQLNIGIKSLTKHGHQVRIEMDQAMATARELNRLHLRNRR